MSKNKFTYGDKIEIVNYGHPIWGSEKMLSGFKKTQGLWEYSVEFEDGNKISWFNEEQLKLI